MKEIKSNKLFEKKLRIYNIALLDELNKFFDEHRKEYKNSMNEMFVELINRGLEVEKIGEQNYRDYNGRFETISDKMTALQKAISVSNYKNQFNIKELISNVLVQEKLMARIYNLLLAVNDRRTLKEEMIEAGFYDDLPEDLEQIKKEVLEYYQSKIWKEEVEEKDENNSKE